MFLTPEQISENFDQFRKYCEDHTGDRSEKILYLVDHIAEQLALCPASSKSEYHNAFPGGLVEHSLRVLRNAIIINKTFDHKIDKQSIVITSLFHDLGKCVHKMENGDLVEYYLPQDSDWHKKQGMVYKYNDAIPYMTIPDRSLWMLQLFGVELSYEEYLAIKLHDGWALDENRKYNMKEPTLSQVIMTADYQACKYEKQFNK